MAHLIYSTEWSFDFKDWRIEIHACAPIRLGGTPAEIFGILIEGNGIESKSFGIAKGIVAASKYCV